MKQIFEGTVAKGFLGGLTIVAVWECLPRFLSIPASIFPPFSSVASTVFSQRFLLMSHLIETVEESILAFIIAIIVAGLLAIAMEENKWIERIFLYPTIAIQNIPKVALAPLLVIWLSYGKAPKVAMGTLIAFFPIFEGFRAGLAADRTGLRSTLTVLGPSRWNLLFRVKLPEAIPNIFQGMRVGITFAIIGVIVGEMVQPSHGLGFLIEQGKENFDTNLQFAAVLVVSIIGLILYGLILLIEHSPIFRHYRISPSS